MNSSFYSDISCIAELEVKRAICGESKKDFLEHCILVANDWFCFPTKTSTEWFDKDGNHVELKDVTLTEIPEDAFYKEDLVVFDVPPSVVSIGGWAFAKCSKLASVTMSEGLDSIEKCAFYNCNALSSVTLPSSIMSIESGAFRWCTQLASIAIPPNVISIQNNVFEDCIKLKSVKIPNGATNIGSFAFYGCAGLESVTIPSSVSSIDKWAFDYCCNIKQFKTDPGNAQRLKRLLNDSCLIAPDAKIIEEDL